MKKTILISCILLALKSNGQWHETENIMYTDMGVKVGIGTTDPGVEVDVNGNVNVTESQLIGKKLSVGTEADHVGLFYIPATEAHPATFSMRGENGQGGSTSHGWPFPSGGPSSGDPLPDLSCTNDVSGLNTLLSPMVSVKGAGVTGNLFLRHNGSHSFIEAQGQGSGGPSNPGHLFINRTCNRNVFVFSNGTTFNPGFNQVMSIAGFLNVTNNVQIGGGNQPTSFQQLSSQLYVNAGANATGISVKHAYGGPGAGIMTTEMNDSDLGLAVFNQVGIQTPQQRFGVQGDGKTIISTSNNDALEISSSASPNVPTFKINVTGETYVKGNVGIGSQPVSNTRLNIYDPSGTSGTILLSLGSLNAANAFNVDNKGVTTINANVASSPASKIFRVRNANSDVFEVATDGTTYARDVIVTLNNFPDYVFSNDYKLMSLSEVRNFIQENKHLPNMPSAKEVEKDGARLGELQKITVEKVEELYLYILQLEEKVADLNKKMEETQKKN